MPYRNINTGDKVSLVSLDGSIMFSRVRLAPFQVNDQWKVMLEGSTIFYDAEAITVLEDHGDHASGPPGRGGFIPDRNLINNG